MKEVKKYLESREGNYSFWFEDMSGGYIYAFNEDMPMQSAGCIKFPISIALLKKYEDGGIDIKERVKIDEDDKVDGTGILHEFQDKTYSIEELLIAMIVQSDNTATNKIIDILSIGEINRIIKLMGLTGTELKQKAKPEEEHDGINENVVTARDLGRCWRMLYKKDFLNDKDSEMLLDILKKQQLKYKLSFYLCDEAKKNAASKSGDLKGVENDSIFFETKKGVFTFTVLSNGLPNNIYGNVTLAKCGKMMYDMIENNWSIRK